MIRITSNQPQQPKYPVEVIPFSNPLNIFRFDLVLKNFQFCSEIQFFNCLKIPTGANPIKQSYY